MSCLGRCDIAPAVAVDERPAPSTDADALVAARAARAEESRRAPGEQRAEPLAQRPVRRIGAPSATALLRALLAGELDADAIVRR